jgi:hypothetical protein
LEKGPEGKTHVQAIRRDHRRPTGIIGYLKLFEHERTLRQTQ